MNMNVKAYTMMPGKKKKKPRDWNALLFKSVLLLPAILFLAVFMYYPIEETFRLSMTRSTGLGPAQFIGFQNYVRLFQNEEFLMGLKNALLWAFWSVCIQIPLAFFIAFSLSVYKNKITKPLRVIYYLSNVLPSAITAMLGKFMFAPRNGVMATLSAKFKWEWLGKIDFLGNPDLAFWSIFTVATWAYSGFYIVYLMANIEQIPKDIQEAAQLDGATRWQYARFIVLPMTSYALRIVSLLCIVGSMKLFDLPWLMTSGGPGYATSTLGIVLYKNGFLNWQYGRGAAVGVIIFLLSLFFTILQFSLQRKDRDA